MQQITFHDKTEGIKYLWDVYKYRHDLIWRTIFKITVSVLFLSVIPYMHEDIIRQLDYFVLILPSLGVFLATFRIFIIKNELDLFSEIKILYHNCNNDYIRCYTTDELVLEKARHVLKEPALFDKFVWSFMILLATLSLLNFIFIWYKWLPQIITTCV